MPGLRSSRFCALAFALCGAGLGEAALAHDLWLEREAGGWVLYQGHRHSTHAGAEIVPYATEAVRQVECLDAHGQPREVTLRRGNPVRIEGDCAVLRIAFSSGYWSKTPWGSVNRPKNEVANALDAWIAEEYVQWIGAWGPAVTRPWPRALTLTPRGDPAALRPGDKLVLRLQRGGQPVAGAAVAYQGEVRGQTDADGVIRIRLRQPGIQHLQASVESRFDDARANRRIETATLQFELKR